MPTQSLGGEAELAAHDFHAPLRNGATARYFLAKLSEAGGVAAFRQGRTFAINKYTAGEIQRTLAVP